MVWPINEDEKKNQTAKIIRETRTMHRRQKTKSAKTWEHAVAKNMRELKISQKEGKEKSNNKKK